jgi:hypothetical protein
MVPWYAVRGSAGAAQTDWIPVSHALVGRHRQYREKIVYFNSRGVIQIETEEVENKAISLGTLD